MPVPQLSMASRRFVRSCKFLLDHVNTPILSSSPFSTFQCGRSGLEVEPRTAQKFLEQSFGDFKCGKEQYGVKLIKKDLLGLGNGFLRRPAHVISVCHHGTRRNEFGLPLGARSLLQSVRTASTTTAGQPKNMDDEQRFMLCKKLQNIKNDDKMILAEGLESLSEEELRQACRERGHLGLLSTEEMHQQEEEKKEKEEKAKQKRAEEAKLKEPEVAEEDLALREMTDATAREELRKAKEHDKEKLCNISRALVVLASASSVSKEHQEFLSLANKETELYNSMLEKEGAKGKEAKKAYFAAREEPDHDTEVAAEENVSSALIEKEQEKKKEKGEKAKQKREEVAKLPDADLALMEMIDATAREELRKPKKERDKGDGRSPELQKEIKSELGQIGNWSRLLDKCYSAKVPWLLGQRRGIAFNNITPKMFIPAVLQGHHVHTGASESTPTLAEIINNANIDWGRYISEDNFNCEGHTISTKEILLSDYVQNYEVFETRSIFRPSHGVSGSCTFVKDSAKRIVKHLIDALTEILSVGVCFEDIQADNIVLVGNRHHAKFKGVRLVPATREQKVSNFLSLHKILEDILFQKKPLPFDMKHLLGLMKSKPLKSLFLMQHHAALFPQPSKAALVQILFERISVLRFRKVYVQLSNLTHRNDWRVKLLDNEVLSEAFYRGTYDEADDTFIFLVFYRNCSAHRLEKCCDPKSFKELYTGEGFQDILDSVFPQILPEVQSALYDAGQLHRTLIGSLFMQY